MPKPDVSVIIPAYNAENSLPRAIESVLTQKTNASVEVLVIDDGSSDNTFAYCEELAQQYPQIKPMKNTRSKGPSGARNTGILAANGRNIAFLDSDDIWLDNHLNEAMTLLNSNEDIDLVFMDFDVVDEDSNTFMYRWFEKSSFFEHFEFEDLGNNYKLIRNNIFVELITESFMHLQSMVIKKSTVGSLLFNETVKRSEDRDFCARLSLEKNAKIACKKITTGIYYRHSDSLTTFNFENSQLANKDRISIFSSYLNHPLLPDLARPLIKNEIHSSQINLAYGYRANKEYFNAIKTLSRCFLDKPGTKPIYELVKVLLFATILRSQDKNKISHESN